MGGLSFNKNMELLTIVYLISVGTGILLGTFAGFIIFLLYKEDKKIIQLLEEDAERLNKKS